MRHRPDFEEEPPAAAEGTGDASEKEVPEDRDDAGTFPVEVDAAGRRFWTWRSAVNFSTHGHVTDDFQGFALVLRLTKYFLQNGGDPRLWFQRCTNRGCATMIDPLWCRGGV